MNFDFALDNSYIFLQYNSPVVDETFTEEKVVAGEQEVPRQCAEPWEIVKTVNGKSDRNYFLETFELDEEDLKIRKTCEL